MAEPLDGVATDASLWDRVPDLVRLEIATWEHAALVPGSWGRADRVSQLRRLLPHELTNPIYERMARAEALFRRRTEPIPPLQERLARDFDGQNLSPQTGRTMSDDDYRLTLQGEVDELLDANLSLNDIMPNWDAEVSSALGAKANEIARKINFGTLGLPRGEFSVAYGYRFSVWRMKGDLVGPQTATHRALLMGCVGPNLQPSPLRDLLDKLFL